MAGQIFVFAILCLLVAFAAYGAKELLFARRQRMARFALLASVALAACCLGVVPAFAADGASDSDTDSAVTVDGDNVALTLGNDLVWAGDIFNFQGETASNDIFAAGQTINVDASTVKGGIRVAGDTISIKDTAVAQSVIVAGRDIRIENSTSTGVALAATDITLSGETGDAYLAAENVTIDGVIHGDVHVDAENLSLGDNAVIEGTLHAKVGEEPLIAAGAQVGEANVDVVERNSDDLSEIAAGLGMGFTIASVVFNILGVFIVAVLAEWLARRQTVRSAAMCKERTAPMLIGGLVGALLAPVILVMLLCTIIGIPLAIALIFLLVALQVIAVGFTAASMAKIAFPDMGRYKSVMLMGVIAAVACVIPLLGGLLKIASFVYVLGYILQCIFMGMREDPIPPHQQPPMPGQPVYPGQMPQAYSAPVNPEPPQN